MTHEVSSSPEFSRLRGPSLVAWLVSNTEHLVLVAGELDGKAAELAPSIRTERVIELCKTVRHAALEITVALLELLSNPEESTNDGTLADAVANAHIRLQQLNEGTPGARG